MKFGDKFEVSSEDKCNKKYILLGFGIAIIVCLAFAGWLIFLTIELKKENNSIKERNEFEAKLRKTNESLIQFINQRINSQSNKIDKMENVSPTQTGQDLQQSFKEIKDHLNRLSSTVANLRKADSKSKISRFRSSLNATRDELARTATNVDELWKYWNRTDREIEDIVNLLAQQNETFHFKIAYHSDKLYSEVKDLEMRQSKFQNDTIRSLKKLHLELNRTSIDLEENFNQRISRVNKTWHRTLEHSIGSVRSSITKINTKLTDNKQDLEKRLKSITDKQNQMKEDFRKTKVAFQEKDRKHDDAISSLRETIKSMESKNKKFEDERLMNLQKIETQERKIKNLESRVEKMENSASGLMKINVKYFITFVFMSLSISFN